MTQPGQPGFYLNKKGQAQWWDGTSWGQLAESETTKREPGMAKNMKKPNVNWGENPYPMQGNTQTPSSRNSKLRTLAHLAWILPVAGILIMLISQGTADSMLLASILIGSGVGLWFTWLAVGAIVDEIGRNRV